MSPFHEKLNWQKKDPEYKVQASLRSAITIKRVNSPDHGSGLDTAMRIYLEHMSDMSQQLRICELIGIHPAMQALELLVELIVGRVRQCAVVIIPDVLSFESIPTRLWKLPGIMVTGWAIGMIARQPKMTR